jgi:shikimate dehydrogenase
MLKTGLIGFPLKRSLSPDIFKIFSALTGYKLSYSLEETRPKDLAKTLTRLRACGWTGANVTLPLKTAVTDFLTASDQVVFSVRAANALKFHKTGVTGINTDTRALADAFRENNFTAKGKTAVVWGAGGAAKAALWFLAENKAERITLHSRDLGKARALALGIAALFPKIEFRTRTFHQKTGQAGIFINATPVGMYAPGRLNAAFSINSAYCDMAYLSGETDFIRSARETGAGTIIDGKEILVYQAARALEFWTDKHITEIVELKRETMNMLKTAEN